MEMTPEQEQPLLQELEEAKNALSDFEEAHANGQSLKMLEAWMRLDLAARNLSSFTGSAGPSLDNELKELGTRMGEMAEVLKSGGISGNGDDSDSDSTLAEAGLVCVMTPEVKRRYANDPWLLVELIERHHSGDWGGIGEEETSQMNQDLLESEPVLSKFSGEEDGADLWIWTDEDRLSSCLFLPGEFTDQPWSNDRLWEDPEWEVDLDPPLEWEEGEIED